MSKGVPIGKALIPRAKAARCYAEDVYVVTHGDVYQIMFSGGLSDYYGMKLSVLHGHGLVKRGELRYMTAREINAGLGATVLREQI